MEAHKQLTRVGLPRVVVPIEEPPEPEPAAIDEWRSCCFRMSPPAIAYFGQVFVTVAIIGISTYQLHLADGDCNRSSPYIGLLSFVAGKILSSVITSGK